MKKPFRTVLKSRFKRLKTLKTQRGESSLKKGLAYSLIASALGVLVVVAPLILLPAANMEHFGAQPAPQTLSERMKSLEELYDLGEASTQSCFLGLLTLMAGFAVAIVVYSIVNAKFSR